MKKVILSVEQVQKNRVFKVQDVVTITLSNYSDKAITFVMYGVTRTIPGRDAVLNVPVKPFFYEVQGYTFDIEIKITFDVGYKNLVIDYAKIKNC